MKDEINTLKASANPTPAKVLDRFCDTRYWGKRLENDSHRGMLIYKRTYVEAKVDLTPLEGEGYNPKEPDPKPFDDSAPLDLAELEDDTIQLYLFD